MSKVRLLEQSVETLVARVKGAISRWDQVAMGVEFG